MHLLHIINSMDPVGGGPAQGIRNLDSVMREAGIIREVVCLDSPVSPYLKTGGLNIHALGVGKGPWCYNKRLIPWLEANIHRFEVIIVNGLWTYHSYAAQRVVNERKKQQKRVAKFFVMPHGMLDPYFQKAKGRKLKAIRNWFYWKLVERYVVNNADGLLFTCETELLLARETFYPYHPQREYNVGYGIAQPPAYENKMSLAFFKFFPGLSGSEYLLFLGRIHPKKGVDLLIEAYITLHQIFKKDGVDLPRLVICGPGSDTNFGKRMQRLLNKYPDVKERVFFPGMLEGDAKWGAFYGCQAFVLPSHQENFGIAVAEALACEKPVLISNQVNIWREIKSEDGGIVKDDDLEGTIMMLRDWLNMTKSDQKVMSGNAIKIYQKYFRINDAGQALLKVVLNG